MLVDPEIDVDRDVLGAGKHGILRVRAWNCTIPPFLLHTILQCRDNLHHNHFLRGAMGDETRLELVAKRSVSHGDRKFFSDGTACVGGASAHPEA